MPKGIITITPPEIKPTNISQHKQQQPEGGQEFGVTFIGGKDKPDPEKDTTMGDENPVTKEAEVSPKKEEPGESVDTKLERLRESLGYVSKRKKQEPDKSEEATTDKVEDEKKEEEKPEKKEEAKTQVTKRPAKQELTPGLVESAVTAATKAAIDATRSRERQAEPSKSEPDLGGDDARDYRVFQRLEQDNPQRYSGISKKFLRYVDELKSYRNQWEKDHPGESFDSDADTHAKFYERNEPSYDPNDFEDAKFNLRADSLKQRWEKEQEEKLRGVEDKLMEIELGPKLQAAKSHAVNEMVKTVDPKIFEVLQSKGADGLREENPIAFDVMDNIAVGLNQAVSEIERLSHPSGRYRFDPNNPIHQQLNRFAAEVEGRIKGLPYDEQIRDGRLFASNAEIQGIPQEQRNRYWSLSYDMLKGEIIKDAASVAKKIIEAEHQKIDRYVKSKGLSVAKQPQSQQQEKQEKPVITAPRVKSPAASVEQVSTAKTNLEKPQVGGAVKNLIDNMFSRSV